MEYSSTEKKSLNDTFGSEMHRYMQAPFCDAVVTGSADVRQHQVWSTVFSNQKIVVMEKKPVIRFQYSSYEDADG